VPATGGHRGRIRRAWLDIRVDHLAGDPCVESREHLHCVCVSDGIFLALQILVQRFASESRQAITLLVAAVAVGTFGILDQTVAACRSCNERTLTKFMLDRDFIGRVEQSLPANASVYQLPYIPFPEFPPVKRLHV
jgi:hypothetical protein